VFAGQSTVLQMAESVVKVFGGTLGQALAKVKAHLTWLGKVRGIALTVENGLVKAGSSVDVDKVNYKPFAKVNVLTTAEMLAGPAPLRFKAVKVKV
jgi:hypothetical protein